MRITRLQPNSSTQLAVYLHFRYITTVSMRGAIVFTPPSIPNSYLRSIGSKVSLNSIRGFPNMGDYMSLFPRRGISTRFRHRDIRVVT